MNAADTMVISSAGCHEGGHVDSISERCAGCAGSADGHIGCRFGGFATETTFKTHCAKCHGRVAALARNLEGETRDERVAALSRFLEDHHLDDPAARAAIVKCLVEQTDP